MRSIIIYLHFAKYDQTGIAKRRSFTYELYSSLKTKILLLFRKSATKFKCSMNAIVALAPSG